LNLDNSVELPNADGLPRGLAPLRRKPKQLDEVPAVYQEGGNGAPLIVEIGELRGDADEDAPAGGQGVLVTGQAAAQRDIADLLEDAPLDKGIASAAQRIARQLSIRRRAIDPRSERGSGKIASVPYGYRSDDIDLDRTIEVLSEHPIPEDTDIVVRERMRPKRSVVLIVDVSGSMRGEKIRTTAAAVGALCTDLGENGDQLAIVAFWSDAAVLKSLQSQATSTAMLDRLLRIPAKGLTNVQFGLTVARAELSRSAAPRRTAILLSDAVHNAGPDPRQIARQFPELHVLLQTDGEHDIPLGRDIARLGHGRFALVPTHRDVAPALNRMLIRCR
jgi:Mg-chelatase subunit ChlD